MTAPSRAPAGPLTRPVRETPIVPRASIAGSALVAVIAIMTFLASLTTGAVMLVRSAAGEWQSEVAREVTIQVRPTPGRDIEAEVGKAAELAKATAGVAEVRPFSKAESARLLEPWLGSGLSIDELPVPRLIVVRIASGATPDFGPLRQALAERVAGATIDDHRSFVERMRTMAGTAVIGGAVILILMLTATILSVTFATRGAMATNRPIVEVLHFIGATDSYIAGQFQRHFLILGLKGGAIGGGAALAILLLAQVAHDWSLGTAGGAQLSALFGTFRLGLSDYAVVLGQVVLIAFVTSWTSRRTVSRTLETIQ